ncbi:MAG: tetratricopeptide repeat protein [Syntrophales bacterium]|nr:tetratricopeptide repeat protein [Syntrophales bacterium]MDD5643447.1 tetratricopeptide repeat protein [Syntrophales bacterium]
MNWLRRLPGGLPLLLCLLLAGAALAVYSQVSHHDFLTFDDDMYVTHNPRVRAGLTWPGVKWAFTAVHSSNWHPLTWLSHMLDCQIFGMQPGGHHLTNLAWHLANTILLFLFLARVTGALRPSALVAALFALHPLHVESVAWVSERKDLLSTFFWLAALWAYAGYAAAPSIRRYLAVVLAFILGLLAKPMVVTLPFVLLLLDYWPLGRVPGGPGPAPGFAGTGEPRPRPAPRGYWYLLQEKIPLFALTIISCLITLAAQKGSGAMMPMAIRPLVPRIANALVAYVEYLVKLFWPFPMIFFYPLAPVPWWEAAGAGLVLLVLTIFLLYGSRRHPYLAVGWLWYLGTLVPVIGLVQVGGQAMADRYTYVPFIGLFIIAAWGIAEATAGWRRRTIVLSTSAAALLLACLLASWGQAGYWRNSQTLFTRAIEINPNNYMAFHHLGMDLVNRGKLDQAIAMYKKTLALAPKYPPAYNNLAIAYARQGKFKEAIPLFKEAIKLTPGNVSFYRNLALAYEQEGKKAEAAAVMEQVKWLSGKK